MLKRIGVLSLLSLLLVAVLAVGAVPALAQDTYVDQCMTAPEATAEASAETTAPDNSAITVEVILPNPRGDRSFIDTAAAGAERAFKELGVSGKIVELNGVPEQDAGLRRAVQDKPTLIIGIAMEADTIEEVAGEFPDQKFAAQESFFPETPDLPNMALYNITTHENSYLAGIAAGMLTRTKKVGAVGGLDIPGINMFIIGYEEGVKSVCADCQVDRAYAGSFSDPVKGKELANGMYASGDDILFQVAGRTGEGVLEAAKDTGNFAIGVDTNQDDLYPGTIIVSALKRTDNAVFAFVQSVVDDTFTAGLTTVGLKEGFTGLSWDVGVCSRTFDKNGPKDMVEKLPAVRAAIDAAREKILSGEIKVTNALEAPAS